MKNRTNDETELYVDYYRNRKNRYVLTDSRCSESDSKCQKLLQTTHRKGRFGGLKAWGVI